MSVKGKESTKGEESPSWSSAPPSMADNNNPKYLSAPIDEIHAKPLEQPPIMTTLPYEETGQSSKGLEGDCSSDPVSDLALDKLSILPCTNREEEASSSHCIGNRDHESSQNSYGVYTEDARQCGHILLGQQQELFFCHTLSPGSWFFLPHGTRVYNKLMAFIKQEYWKRGYTEVMSPNMYNMKLWETSGHAANEKENMFTFDVDKQEFGLKHVNCPGHCLIFQQRVRSYRELPMRLADFGVLHQNEAGGALTGLTHVRRFQQDDAHIFCTKDQVREEVKGVLDFVDCVYTKFGFTYELKLSTRPEKYLGDLETWVRAEEDLEKALKEFGKPFLLSKGNGKFYGPSIDVRISDAVKKNIQCGTLQLDFQQPDRFKLEYSSSAEDEVKRERPVMIHRAVLGSVEQMFFILLEHYEGKWPFWLSPRQAIVCSLSEKHRSYAEKVRDQIHEARYYVDVDISGRKIEEKVREAQAAHYNYILAVGDEEAATGQVGVRLREENGSDFEVMSIEALLDVFKAQE